MTVRDVRRDARAFLAERGIVPDADGRYDEGAVEDAVRGRGWDVTADGVDGDWVVQISEELAPTRFRAVSGGDPDRMTALLQALDVALAWPDGDEARRVLDEEAPALLGMSGDEFRRRWRAGELDAVLTDPYHPEYPSVWRLAGFVTADRSIGR